MILGNSDLFDAMLKTAGGVLILCAWTYVVLEQRDLRRQLRATRKRVHTHHRAIVYLQATADDQQATTTAQPMATVTRLRPPSLLPAEPPPTAVTELEQALAERGTMTRLDLARYLGRQPWEILGDLKRLMLDGRIHLTESHTAGEPTYALADPTLRLPGAVAR
jgi:hypothetical protein